MAQGGSDEQIIISIITITLNETFLSNTPVHSTGAERWHYGSCADGASTGQSVLAIGRRVPHCRESHGQLCDAGVQRCSKNCPTLRNRLLPSMGTPQVGQGFLPPKCGHGPLPQRKRPPNAAGSYERRHALLHQIQRKQHGQ